MRRFVFVLIASIAVTTIGLSLVPRRAPQQGNGAAYLLTQINALRQSKGLAPLVINALLATSATGHSTYLADHPWTNPHVEDNGSTPQSRAVAVGYTGIVSENVVGGSTATAQWGFQWWLNSPIHLQNMLYAQWIEVGIGVADGPYGRYFTTDFGAGDGPRPTWTVVSTANISAISHNPAVQKPPPTRRPTALPTATPSITFTPIVTFTPRPTFTPTITPTEPPPTPTAILLQASPQPTNAQPSPRPLAAVPLP